MTTPRVPFFFRKKMKKRKDEKIVEVRGNSLISAEKTGRKGRRSDSGLGRFLNKVRFKLLFSVL